MFRSRIQQPVLWIATNAVAYCAYKSVSNLVFLTLQKPLLRNEAYFYKVRKIRYKLLSPLFAKNFNTLTHYTLKNTTSQGVQVMFLFFT